ncbi:hypothetical protein [Gilliamella apicola]|uniref:Uncharacterized protein n=1 Tax=Gilliamella apicola TaxID=1196095 RepID=A0A2V4E3G1_9GAMM|nr:hypothetical protein [Gilliamella apicola]PXZ05711.1 hypothetical protein DKK79_03265 [Gilliamella apicola]
MNFSEKLVAQSKFKGILLFNDGVFLRAYNEGVYILTELLGYNFKVNAMQLKKYNYRWVVTCAFPLNKLNVRLPNAELTEFGSRYNYAYDVKDYSRWFAQCCHNENHATSVSPKMDKQYTSEKSVNNCRAIKCSDGVYLKLNQKQVNYLLNWQQGYYSSEIDTKFIQSLKKILLTNYDPND